MIRDQLLPLRPILDQAVGLTVLPDGNRIAARMGTDSVVMFLLNQLDSRLSGIGLKAVLAIVRADGTGAAAEEGTAP